MKKIFLDSDIILDALLKREGFYLPAANVLAMVYQKKIKGLTSAIAFVNVHYFLNKHDRANKMELLSQTRALISIINVDEKIIDQALKINHPDFEDMVQYSAAINAGCDAIITRNVKDYKHSTIPVLTAEQFLREII